MTTSTRAPSELAACIEHTLLDPAVREEEIERLCEDALAFGFAAVCVQPAWVSACALRLRETPVRVCSVAGFPCGVSHTDVRALEVRKAVDDGAQEIDVVIRLDRLKAGDRGGVLADLQQVRAAAGPALVKVILETGLLTNEEVVLGARATVEAGAAFVKTSTGRGPRGATVEDVALLRQAVGGSVRIKAAGGIRTLAQAEALLHAGAARLGTSAGIEILGERNRR